MPNVVSIGSVVDLHMTGPANHMGLLFLSLGTACIPYGNTGTVCTDLSSGALVFTYPFTFDDQGHATFTAEVDCDPLLAGLLVYGQFITCGGKRGAKSVSNLDSTCILDGICDGDFCTYTQGGWGAPCSGNNPGCLRDQWFSSVFPSGAVIGDPDGIDGDAEYAALFTDAAAIEAFLPSGKKASVLTEDATDPTETDAGVFAGQLLAARLNVSFDDYGALDECKGRDDVKLGDLVFLANVDSDLLGWTVRDVIDLSDAAISGVFGTDPIDLDGDNVGDVTIGDLSSALDVFNNNFDDGTQNNGNLGLP